MDPIKELDKHDVHHLLHLRKPNLLAKIIICVYTSIENSQDIQFENLGMTLRYTPRTASASERDVTGGEPRSGKTHMVSNLFHRLKQAGSIDRILFVAAFHSNKKMMEELSIDEETDVFDPEDDPVQKL